MELRGQVPAFVGTEAEDGFLSVSGVPSFLMIQRPKSPWEITIHLWHLMALSSYIVIYQLYIIISGIVPI